MTSAAASSDSGAATAHLKLTFRPLDITVSFPFLDGVSAFFAPEEQVNLDNFIFAAAEQAEALRQTSAAKAQDVLSSSSKMLVDVTISPPTILVPADVSWTAEGDGAGSLPGNGHDLMLCVAIGELTIASVEGLVCEEISLSDAVTPFHKPSQEYDPLAVTVTGTKVIIASRLKDYRDEVTQTEHDLQLITNLDIELQVDRCIAPFHGWPPQRCVGAGHSVVVVFFAWCAVV